MMILEFASRFFAESVILPALKIEAGVPMRIRNTMAAAAQGTLIDSSKGWRLPPTPCESSMEPWSEV